MSKYKNNASALTKGYEEIDTNFKFKDLTVDDIYDAINVHKDRWLNISNGGQVNLGYVICYQPWRFYKHDSYKKKVLR